MNLIFWLRSFVMAMIYPFYFLLCTLGVLTASLLGWSEMSEFVIKYFGRGSLWMFGVKAHIEGLENVPENGCVYVFNHTSFFDIFIISGYLHRVRFGAKIELFKVPVLSFAMRTIGTLPIARGNVKHVIRVYEQAAIRAQKGRKFALAPEGTRNDEEKLRAFKSGPFIFAIQAKVPVVPVVIKGAYDVMPKGSWFPNTDRWTREISMRVLPATSTIHLTVDNKEELMTKVRDQMQAYFI